MTHTIIRIQGGTSDGIKRNHRAAGLLMSATLTPPVGAVARANPTERIGDYLNALKHYASLPDTTIDRILFIDNSYSDLTPLANALRDITHTKTIELISFSGNDHPVRLGKAHGEFRLMDFGLAHTTLFEPDDIIWKTSGRLRILNLTEMIESCRTLDFDVLCDLRNVPLLGSGKWQGSENMDLRLFAFRRSAYDTVFAGLWKTHEGHLDAGFLYRHLIHLRSEAKELRVIPRFPRQPRLQGISGRHQRDYQSPPQRAKDALRAVIRRIAPSLWI
ncbi:hypothetical protein [Propionivibrio limicola]|uniref:hypothetical protein n=1 Tax=Propionivibrio limicola TaxID=167645 RepID=UPI0012915DEC|nr:hypothetical protein [Propionivibrio limicola]